MIRGLRKEFANSERTSRSHAMIACSPSRPSCTGVHSRGDLAEEHRERAARFMPPQAAAILFDDLRNELGDCDSGWLVRYILESLIEQGLPRGVAYQLELEQHRRLGRALLQEVLS